MVNLGYNEIQPITAYFFYSFVLLLQSQQNEV